MILQNRQWKIYRLILCGLWIVASFCNADDADPLAPHQVVVIGAGISGLTAAKALTENGHEVIILEARDRIGGRVWTQQVESGIPLDLGAGWIHGINRNPLTEIAKELKLPLHVTDYDNAVLFSYKKGGIASDERRWGKLEAIISRVVENASGNLSVQEAVDEALEGILKAGFSNEEIAFVVNTLIEHEYGADAKDLSVRGPEEGKDFGGADVVFSNGFGQITDYLAKDLEIKTEQVVTEIDYRGDLVKITTNAGKVWFAEKVLITVPLGVLQKKSITFIPPLPQEKQMAIQTLGMGLLNKLYLQFPAAFWDGDAELFGFVSEEKGRWCEWYNMQELLDKPVLLGFVAGSYAVEMETHTDQEIVRDAMDVLRMMFGNEIPEPTQVYMTRWAMDPYAGGSYSYIKTGSRPWMRKTLASPIDDKVFFAGEATDSDYPATVHGAYLSGIREAKSIHRVLKSR